jgi:hypothetical protein
MKTIDRKDIFNKLNQYTKPTINIIIKVIIESIDESELTGEEKKQFAIELINDYAISIPPSEFRTALINAISTDLIGDMIDLIISASKGELLINKKSLIQYLIKCLNCGLSFLNKK